MARITDRLSDYVLVVVSKPFWHSFRIIEGEMTW